MNSVQFHCVCGDNSLHIHSDQFCVLVNIYLSSHESYNTRFGTVALLKLHCNKTTSTVRVPFSLSNMP